MISDSKTDIVPFIKGKALTADANIKLEGRLYENESELDISDPNAIHFIEGLAKEKLNKEVNTVLYKLQKEFNSDIYGFGAAFRRKYHRQWDEQLKDDWNNIYPNLQIKLNIDITISRIGFVTKLDKKQ